MTSAISHALNMSEVVVPAESGDGGKDWWQGGCGGTEEEAQAGGMRVTLRQGHSHTEIL